MKITLFFLILFLPIADCAFAAENNDRNSCLIYGKDHSYFLTAPAGWVLDNKSGLHQGIHAVFYPNGSSWRGGSVVMYTTVVAKTATNDTLQKVIDGDVNRTLTDSPEVKVIDGSIWPTTKDKKQSGGEVFCQR